MHIIDSLDLNVKELHGLFELAERNRFMYELRAKNPQGLQFTPSFQTMNGVIMGCYFEEPSTRTMWSFSSAMQRLGGKVITSSDVSNTSRKKGESLQDTINTLANYVDVLVMRTEDPIKDHDHFILDLPESCHIINAGDGKNEHPTQALTDAYTIWRVFGVDLEDLMLTIGIVGNVEISRTVHSLLAMMGQFQENKFIIYDNLEGSLGKWSPIAPTEMMGLDEFLQNIPDMDVLYLNRQQTERMSQDQGFLDRILGGFELTPGILKDMQEDAIVMNPGPRLEEMPEHPDIDGDPRVIYPEQTRNGLYIRMALLQYIFGTPLPK